MTNSRSSRTVEPFDIEVGQRIWMIRRNRGISRQQLARSLNITSQQIQKYERGINRISASKLKHIADALGVSLSELLDDVEVSPGQAVSDPELGRFIATLDMIKDRLVRQALIKLVQSIVMHAQDANSENIID